MLAILIGSKLNIKPLLLNNQHIDYDINKYYFKLSQGKQTFITHTLHYIFLRMYLCNNPYQAT